MSLIGDAKIIILGEFEEFEFFLFASHKYIVIQRHK